MKCKKSLPEGIDLIPLLIGQNLLEEPPQQFLPTYWKVVNRYFHLVLLTWKF